MLYAHLRNHSKVNLEVIEIQSMKWQALQINSLWQSCQLSHHKNDKRIRTRLIFPKTPKLLILLNKYGYQTKTANSTLVQYYHVEH